MNQHIVPQECFAYGISRRVVNQHTLAADGSEERVAALAARAHRMASDDHGWPERATVSQALAEQQSVMALDMQFFADGLGDTLEAGRLRLAADQTLAKAQAFASGLDGDVQASQHRHVERH